jgi:hypothetical protein
MFYNLENPQFMRVQEELCAQNTVPLTDYIQQNGAKNSKNKVVCHKPFCPIPFAMSYFSWLTILSQKLGPVGCLGSGKKPVFRFYVVFRFPVKYCK